MSRKFDFVNISNPKQGLSKADRTVVRSQAALSGYDSLIGPRRDPTSRRRKRKDAGGRGGQPTAGEENSPSSPTKDQQEQPSANDVETEVSLPVTEEYAELVRRLDVGDDVEIIPLAPPIARNPGAGRIDPFWTFPVIRKPFMPAVIDYQITNLCPPVPELDSLHERALLRYFSIAMTEPALLYSLLAFAAAHSAAARKVGFQGEDVLWLKGMAITSINQALKDTRRSLLDPTIGAVITMASYEHIYGDKDSFHAHMLGAQKMISLRGGLRHLGLDGFSARIFAWVDRCQAFLTGAKLYFDHDEIDAAAPINVPEGDPPAGAQLAALAKDQTDRKKRDAFFGFRLSRAVSDALTDLDWLLFDIDKLRWYPIAHADFLDYSVKPLADLERRLLAASPSHTPSTPPPRAAPQDPTLNEILRLGGLSLTYSLMAHFSTTPPPTLRARLSAAASALLAAFPPAAPPPAAYAQELFWAATMAGHRAADMTRLRAAELARGLAVALELTAWAEARTVLRRFLYLPLAHDGPCREFWRFVMFTGARDGEEEGGEESSGKGSPEAEERGTFTAKVVRLGDS